MRILEHRPSQDDILDFINDSIRQLQEGGADAKYVVLGTDAYERFRQAMAVRFKRKPKNFETYNYLAVVLDPFRTDGVAVLPGPGECTKGVSTYRMD